MAGPWEKYAAPAPQSAPPGVLATIPGRVDPYKVRDQQLQEEANERAREDQKFQREKFEREMAKADKATDPKLVEGERTAAFLATRVAGGMQDLREALSDNPDAAKPTVGQAFAGLFGSTARGWANTPARRQVEAAQMDILDAALTLGTGAAYTREQLEGYREAYFPTLTDDPETIRGKQERLERLLESAKVKAGSAAPQIDEALAALGGKQVSETKDGERIYEGGSPQSVELSDGGTQRIDDPVLAGVNAKINGMLKAGESGTAIANYLKQAGIPLNAVNLREVLQWRKANPGYKGDYTVNIDDKLVPMSGMRSLVADAANSPFAAGVVSAADTITGGHLDNIVGAAGGNAELANMGIGMLRDANPKASFVGDLTGGGLLYGAGGAGLQAVRGATAPATGTLAGRAIAGDAALGGYIGSGQGGTQAFSPGNALAGAVGGAGGGILGRGAINTAGRTLSPTGGRLAPFYEEGGQPSLGQRVGGVVNRAEQAFGNIPLLGGIQRANRNQAVEQWQAGAFNKALREIDGIDGVKGRLPTGVKTGPQAHAYMQRSFNRAYDKARSGLTFRRDPQFDQEFTDLVTNEVATLGQDGQNIFKTFVDRGTNLLNARNGVLSGDDYKSLVSRIEAKVRGLRKSPNGDTELADALEGLSLALDSAARRHSAPEAVKALDSADRGYVMAVLIEEAARQRGTDIGEFTGKNLEGAILNNSGRRSRRALRGEAPLQDYAKAGKELGDTMPDSGTAERLMYGSGTAGLMGAAAQFTHPLTLAPWALDTLANIPGIKQAVNAIMAPNRKALDPARQRLMERAHLGGLLAAPGAQATAQ